MTQVLIALSFAVSYLVRVLLFEERVSHFGPWPSREATVVRIRKEGDEVSIYKQPVTFFDRIRFWTSRAYEIDQENNEWYVREDRMEMWSCPKCLTFWMSAAVVIPYCLFTGKWKQIPLMVAAVSGGAYLIHNLNDLEFRVNMNSFYEAETDAQDGDEDEAL
jgi:hypothetical protein